MVFQFPVTELPATTKTDGAGPDAPDGERNPGPAILTVGACDQPAHIGVAGGGQVVHGISLTNCSRWDRHCSCP